MPTCWKLNPRVWMTSWPHHASVSLRELGFEWEEGFRIWKTFWMINCFWNCWTKEKSCVESISIPLIRRKCVLQSYLSASYESRPCSYESVGLLMTRCCSDWSPVISFVCTHLITQVESNHMKPSSSLRSHPPSNSREGPRKRTSLRSSSFSTGAPILCPKPPFPGRPPF